MDIDQTTRRDSDINTQKSKHRLSEGRCAI